MVISTDNFISEIILFLRDKLRDNITDPLERGADWIFTAFPKQNTIYPLCTIKITNLSTENLGMQSETTLINLDVEIRTWARNSKEADTLTQEIINLLRTSHFGEGSTNVQDILGFRLGSVNAVVETNDSQTIHSKVLNFKYQFILS